MIAAAFVCLGISYYNASDWNPGRFVFFALLGIGLLLTAYWMNDFSGGWWWLLAFLPAAGVIGAGAYEISDDSGFGSATGWLLVVVCVGLAIAGPLWIAPTMQARLAESPPVTAAEPTEIPTMAPTTAISTATALQTAIPTEVAAVEEHLLRQVAVERALRHYHNRASL